jgi:hypothetical protein
MSSEKSKKFKQSLSAADSAELPDELLDQVAGGGDHPTNTAQDTGSAKSLTNIKTEV